MRKFYFLVLALMFMASMAFAQATGSVSGFVRDSLDNPVSAAMVSLMTTGGGGMHHNQMGNNYRTQSGADGSFTIQNVASGEYVAMASKMMIGHDSDSITVVSNQNTVVNFVLTSMGGHHGGGMHGDSLEIVNITGWAIVIADSMHNQYFLDNDGDDQADFRLLFGPDWYNPGNGAQRPADGDSIWVTGGLMGYSQPQAVVVYEINGLFWRQPGMGHGGFGGGGGYPHPDSVVAIETSGITIIQENHGMTRYLLDSDYNSTANYILNFGPPSYNPSNGATRPEAGDSVAIVGGLMDRPGDLDMIIVYEINGQEWWRDPGDTTDLWPRITSVDEANLLPSEYLVANSYPNPFNPSAMIAFDLPSAGNVNVSVYDILGKEVVNLADNYFSAGHHELQFTPTQKISSAIYFYKVSIREESTIGKMIFLK